MYVTVTKKPLTPHRAVPPGQIKSSLAAARALPMDVDSPRTREARLLVRQVLAALTLREESSLRVEMQVYDRQLEMEQMRARMRGGGAS